MSPGVLESPESLSVDKSPDTKRGGLTNDEFEELGRLRRLRFETGPGGKWNEAVDMPRLQILESKLEAGPTEPTQEERIKFAELSKRNNTENDLSSDEKERLVALQNAIDGWNSRKR
jgi:hypothetical protein